MAGAECQLLTPDDPVPVVRAMSCRCGAAWPRCDRGVGDDRCPVRWCRRIAAHGYGRIGTAQQRCACTAAAGKGMAGWEDWERTGTS
jgi:hypothetical protein